MAMKLLVEVELESSNLSLRSYVIAFQVMDGEVLLPQSFRTEEDFTDVLHLKENATGLERLVMG